MNKKMWIGIISVIFLFNAAYLFSEGCDQKRDKIRLYIGGIQIRDSNFFIAERVKDGRQKIVSYCIEGTCFSEFFTGDVSNVFFGQVTDESTLKKLESAINDTRKTILKQGHTIIADAAIYDIELLNLYTNDNLINNTVVNNLILGQINEIKKYPFLNINSLKNNFSNNNCSRYQRVITYDLVTKNLALKEFGN
ncbi:MAG: hypothetical protein AB1472_00420 [Candidatus Omnitrophota bacterium]